ncbi:hypothetical protein Tco_0580200 [Tanacetum coccineum]
MVYILEKLPLLMGDIPPLISKFPACSLLYRKPTGIFGQHEKITIFNVSRGRKVSLIIFRIEKHSSYGLFARRESLRWAKANLGLALLATKKALNWILCLLFVLGRMEELDVFGACTTTTTVDELTLAQTLMEIKAAKPKVVTTAATITTTTVIRPKARGGI